MGLNHSSLVIAIEIINNKLGLSLKVYNNGVIAMNSKSRCKLFPIWRELAMQYGLPKCMYYKLNMHNKLTELDPSLLNNLSLQDTRVV
jgi:hypothetical protein